MIPEDTQPKSGSAGVVWENDLTAQLAKAKAQCFRDVADKLEQDKYFMYHKHSGEEIVAGLRSEADVLEGK